MNFPRFVLPLLFGVLTSNICVSQNLQPVNYPVHTLSHVMPDSSVDFIRNIDLPLTSGSIEGYAMFGKYSQISGVARTGLVFFNSDTIFELGPLLSGKVCDLTILSGGKLMVASDFTNNGGSNTAIRDINGNWTYRNIGNGEIADISDYYWFSNLDSERYYSVGGSMTDALDAYEIYEYYPGPDSAAKAGNSFNGPINAVQILSSTHVVGGDFTSNSGTSTPYIAYLDRFSSWDQT